MLQPLQLAEGSGTFTYQQIHYILQYKCYFNYLRQEQNRCSPRLKGDDNALAIIYSANHPFEKKKSKEF